MGRRTFAEIDAHARADERMGFAAQIEVHCGRIDRAVGRGRVNDDQARFLKNALRGLAGETATGLHLGGTDAPGLRHVMRQRIEAAKAAAKGEGTGQ